MIYVAEWLLSIIVAASAFRSSRAANRYITVGFLFLLGLTIVIRNSGNDTSGVYEPIANVLLWRGSLTGYLAGMEPGFTFLLMILSKIAASPVGGVRLLGLVFVAILLVFIWRADRTEALFFFSYYIPSFFFQHGMNTIRFGMAAAFLLLAWQRLRRNRKFSFLVISTLSVFFHYSSLVCILLIVLLEWRLGLKSAFLAAVFVVIIGYIAYIQSEYFLEKYVLYGYMKGFSRYSGLSRAFLVSLFLFPFCFSKIPKIQKFPTVLILCSSLVCFQIMAAYSYAGIRLVEIVSFAAPLLIIRAYDRSGLSIDNGFKYALLLSGMIASAFLYRNFWMDMNGRLTGTQTPFLPYRTLWGLEIR